MTDDLDRLRREFVDAFARALASHSGDAGHLATIDARDAAAGRLVDALDAGEQ